MLKPKKKISKKELKQDTLITTYMKVTRFYDQYKKQISIGVTAVIVVVAATMIFLSNRAKNNDLATAKLAAINQFSDNGQYQMAIDGVPDRNLVGLKQIVEDYGSTPAGDHGAVLSRRCLLPDREVPGSARSVQRLQSVQCASESIALRRYCSVL